MFRLRILGSAAGGGFPQWNCACAVCIAARDGRATPRTQSSIAVSGDGMRWALINASPDLREQLAATPELHPRPEEAVGGRHSPIASVLLTNADVDHVAGLLNLREGQAFRLLATAKVHGVLDANPIFRVLNPAVVAREPITLDTPVDLGCGVTAELFAVPGKIALWMENGTPEIGALTEDTVGVRLTPTGADGPAVFYIPGCAAVPDDLKTRVDGADALLFDGTLWTDDEMVRAGLGTKTGRRMGHISMDGPDGSIAAWRDVAIGRRIFVHINNSNPTLLDGSPERRAAETAGWHVAADGDAVTFGT